MENFGSQFKTAIVPTGSDYLKIQYDKKNN